MSPGQPLPVSVGQVRLVQKFAPHFHDLAGQSANRLYRLVFPSLGSGRAVSRAVSGRKFAMSERTVRIEYRALIEDEQALLDWGPAFRLQPCLSFEMMEIRVQAPTSCSLRLVCWLTAPLDAPTRQQVRYRAVVQQWAHALPPHVAAVPTRWDAPSLPPQARVKDVIQARLDVPQWPVDRFQFTPSTGHASSQRALYRFAFCCCSRHRCRGATWFPRPDRLYRWLCCGMGYQVPRRGCP